MTDETQRPVALGCPHCSGGMYFVEADGALRYRCHVGHDYTPPAMLAAQRTKIESSLWTAISLLEEQAVVHQHLATRAAQSGATTTVDDQCTAAGEILRAADTIRKHLAGIAP